MIYAIPWICLATLVFSFVCIIIYGLGQDAEKFDNFQWKKFIEEDKILFFLSKVCIISFFFLYVSLCVALVYYFTR